MCLLNLDGKKAFQSVRLQSSIRLLTISMNQVDFAFLTAGHQPCGSTRMGSDHKAMEVQTCATRRILLSPTTLVAEVEHQRTAMVRSSLCLESQMLQLPISG